jgi:hypothetical protein
MKSRLRSDSAEGARWVVKTSEMCWMPTGKLVVDDRGDR